MKEPVFSGPSGRKWRAPRRDQLVKPGDQIKLKGGTLTMISLNEDGTATIEARDRQNEVMTFTARRGDNGEWSERVQVDASTMSDSAWAYVEPKLPEFDASMIEHKGWQAGFKDAAMSQNIPVNPFMGGSSYMHPLRTRNEDELQVARRQQMRMERELSHAKVKHRKTEPATDAEYEADVIKVSTTLRDGLKLERPQGSSFHHLMQYLDEVGMDEDDDKMWKFISRNFQSMVIEHDWAAAFEGVEGMNDTGEVPMPFDYTCFEFRISGIRMLVLMGLNDAQQQEAVLCSGVNGRWYTSQERFQFVNGEFVMSREIHHIGGVAVEKMGDLLHLIGRQIRAVCIMLDAEVAEADEERPSPALNKARRAQGRSELKPYHVVRIHRQHRHRGASTGDGTGARKRAHVRRGHWRHFTVGTGREQYTDKEGTLRSRTWINWMLVGDPAIVGFVDKEYRL